MSKKYKYLYQTTNLINGKIYIGVHCTDDLDDGYIGSGHILKKAISKYGRGNFVCEILEWFDSVEKMYEREKQIVDERFVERNDNYNLGLGGKNQTFYGKDNPFYGKSHTQESIEKMKIKLSDTLSGQIYINKNGCCKRIHPQDWDYYCDQGWSKGTLNKNTVWINKDGKHRMVCEERLNDYINSGWCLGRVNTSCQDRVWVNNGNTQRMVELQDLDTYYSQGWTRGNLNKTNNEKRCLNKGGKNKFVSENEINDYLFNGWEIGMIKKDFENPFKGKSHTDEMKEHIRQKASENSRGRIWINKNGITKMVYPNELNNFLNSGWRKGRK